MFLAPDPVTLTFVGGCSGACNIVARGLCLIPLLRPHKSVIGVSATAIGGFVGFYFWVAALLGTLSQPGYVFPKDPGLVVVVIGTTGVFTALAAPVLLWLRYVRGVVFDPGAVLDGLALLIFVVSALGGLYLGLH